MKANLKKIPSSDTTLSLNKIVCDDAVVSLKEIQEENFFDLVIADPPYNIGKDFGNTKDYRELPDYLHWCDEWIAECLRLAKATAPIFIYGFPEILAHIAVRYPLEKQKWLVWHYTNKAVPSLKFWQRSHESILCIWKEKKPQLRVDAIRENYTESFLKNAAGKVRKETYCRYSTKGKKTIYQAHPNGALPRDVLKIPALAGGAGYSERWFFCKDCNRLCFPNETESHLTHNTIKHPTQKPANLTKKLIASATDSKGCLLVPFAGSGSECVVAQEMEVNFFATEINPDYVLLANSWLKKTEKKTETLF